MDPTNMDPSGNATWTTQVTIIFLVTKFPLSEVCNVWFQVSTMNPTLLYVSYNPHTYI